MDNLTAYAFEVLTVPKGSAGAATLTKTVYGHNPKAARITINAGVPVSYRMDGVSATTGTGHAITAFGTIILEGHQQIKDFTVVSTQSATATSISVSYLK